MLQKFLATFTLFIALSYSAIAQNISKSDSSNSHKASVFLGMGMGLNYGGYGVQGSIQLFDHFRFGAAYGTNLIDMVYNLGLQYRIFTNKRLCPNFGYMYGYNGAIFDKDNTELSKTYYGSSLYTGLEYWGKSRKKFFLLNIILPVRSLKFDQSNIASNASSFYELFNYNPIVISLGVHFKLK